VKDLCLRHIALNSSVEYFQEFRRSGRGKSKANDLHTVYQQINLMRRDALPIRQDLISLIKPNDREVEPFSEISRNIGHAALHNKALKSSGTSPNLRDTVAALKSPGGGIASV
jgi:hypothetical protein